MNDIMQVKANLEEIKDRLGKVPGMHRDIKLEWGEVVDEKEITSLEMKLGNLLPPSFGQAIGSLGRSLSFFYSLLDFHVPDEFNEIFSGGISYHIKNLTYISDILGITPEEEDDEQQKSYIRQVSSMLRFADSGNGDIYAFDMAAQGEEKPVVYWEHETCEVKYLADSFQDYLDRISKLYFVGDEIWQLELFVEENGINPENEYALRWRTWFETLLEPIPKDALQDLNSLFAIALTRKKCSSRLLKSMLEYKKEDIMEMIQKKLLETNCRDTQEILVTMVGELIGTDAEKWVESLWEQINSSIDPSSKSAMDQYDIPSDLLAFLSAKCMKEEKAFLLLTEYLTKKEQGRIDGVIACDHLKYFDKSLVIAWMEKQNINAPLGWDQLFMSVSPDWKDLLRWSEDGKRRKVVIDGLSLLTEGKEKLPLPSGLPDRKCVTAWLQQLEETELLNIRKNKIRKILDEVDQLYEK